MSVTMHCGEAGATKQTCAYCGGTFEQKRRWEAFCSPKCRNDYNTDIGTEGAVAAVRKIKGGASVVVHLTGPAAERALRLELRDVVKLVKTPAYSQENPHG